jgi:hypothetical protein
MAYIGGTLAANKCISELTSMGALVDVYSKKWLLSNPDFVNFDIDNLSDFQLESNGVCEGHLLVISTSLDFQIVSKLLVDAHPSFEKYFGPQAAHHKPDLIFINLLTQQILCVGLGRKNYFFGYVIGADDIKISDGNISNVIHPLMNKDEFNPTVNFMREFIRYDYSDIVTSQIEALYVFGQCARNYDQLPLTPDQIEEIIQQGPDGEGMYDIDDQLMSLDEARAVIAELEEVNDWGKENLSTLQIYFPELTWGDLNTQDY